MTDECEHNMWQAHDSIAISSGKIGVGVFCLDCDATGFFFIDSEPNWDPK